MRNGTTKISKRKWQELGGLRNSHVFRKADARGRWGYYVSDWQLAVEASGRISTVIHTASAEG